LKVNLLVVIILFFLFCHQEKEEFTLTGTWKDLKSESIYEKDKLENMYEFINVNDIYYGKVIGLDLLINNKSKIRSCGNCEKEESVMLLGYNIIKNLKYESNSYKGEIFDPYNNKWFDVKISFINKDTINVRMYAILPLFGKNTKWVRAENYYHNLLKRETIPLDSENEKVYAITPGDIEDNSSMLLVKPNTDVSFLKNAYCFDKFGELQMKIEFYKKEDNITLFTYPQSMNTKKGTLVYFLKK
jgi:uncharacterized protein (DUF2147 family)